MPSLEEDPGSYNAFDALFFTMAVFNIFGIIYIIFKQTQVDLFFIDFEPQ